MIGRYVFIRLKPEFRGSALPETVRHSRRVLEALPHVNQVHVGIAADAHAQKGWDMSLALTFENLAAVEAYRSDPAHRSYVDAFLRPRVEVLKAWNFNIG